MQREQWVDGTSGLRGPQHLVQLAESELAGHRACAEAVHSVPDQPGALVTVLLLAGLARDCKTAALRWTAAHIRSRQDIDRRTDVPHTSPQEVAVYVCLCKGLKESDVQRAARAGNTSPESLIGALGLRDPMCCGRCAREVDTLVRLAVSTTCTPPRQLDEIAP
jgi:bacterioferritin-associated ferredoxin